MRTWLVGVLLAVVLASPSLSCVEGPKVLQGIVVSYDPATKILVLKDELPPGQEQRFSIAGAEVGAPPSVGDKLRLAYRQSQKELVATRVANISRQDELRGKKSH
jgi:hypothetical protein